MNAVQVYTLSLLPPVAPRRDPLGRTHPAALRAYEVMVRVYHSHQSIADDRAEQPVGLTYPAPITFRHQDLTWRDGYGAAVGPSGDGPLATILVSTDSPPAIILVTTTREWVGLYGQGELPNPGDVPGMEGR